MSEHANAKNKDCRCTVNNVMRGTKRCEHGWEFDQAITVADRMRGLIEQMRKLSRSPKLKELLDEMGERVEEIESDAQEWYDDWQSQCEGRVEDQKEAEEQQTRNDAWVEALDNALTDALADRNALLERLGLTDFAWAMQGGTPAAHMEARMPE